MERRTGIAVAGAVAMVLVAGAIAAGANLGLLGLGRGKSDVGKLRPADAVSTVTQPPQVITVEVQDPSHAATATVTTGVDQSAGAPVEVVNVPVPQRSLTAGHEGEHEQEGEPVGDGHSSDD